MPVVEVGIGVGYLIEADPRPEGDPRALLSGRGKAGEEDNGSNAGSSDGAGRLTPATGGKLRWEFILLGEESIMTKCIHPLPTVKEDFSWGSRTAFRTRLTSTLDIEGLNDFEKDFVNVNHVQTNIRKRK